MWGCNHRLKVLRGNIQYPSWPRQEFPSYQTYCKCDRGKTLLKVCMCHPICGSGNKVIIPRCWHDCRARLGTVRDDKSTCLKASAEFNARFFILAVLLELWEVPDSTFIRKQLLWSNGSGSFFLTFLWCAVFQAHSAQVCANGLLGLFTKQAVDNVSLHLVCTVNTKSERQKVREKNCISI